MMTKIKWNVQACLLGLLLAFVGVSFSACSDDDDENNGGGGNVNITASQLYGTWKWVSDQGWEQEPGGEKEPWKNEMADAGLVLTFNSNGTIIETWENYGDTWNGTWSLQGGNTLVWDSDAYTITNFTGNRMTIEFYEDKNGYISWDQYVFQKVN
ncbi:MAG: hypothetical protein J6B92_03210 [Paraprevotella sp.]|nr:hypothetical protein [Paraprevotella sp.]MBP3472279.1 hypothetical protein [Paraprevotella sp.]